MPFLPELSPSKPAAKLTALIALCGVFVAMEIGIWLTFVPDALSVQTFAWMSALAFMITIATAASVIRARSTRSIAHVLYDVEHPADGSRS